MPTKLLRLTVLLFLGLGSARLAPAAALTATTDEVEAALERAAQRRSAWEAALASVDGEARADFEHLVAAMPTTDLAALDPAWVLADAKLAREAWLAAPWQASVPLDVFREALLPYVNVDEPREDWRPVLRVRALELVKSCTTSGAAAQALNAQLFGEWGVRYSTERRRANQSPSETMETGTASCTGLSILLVDACRAVGVPARLVGIGEWPHKNGNHTWVEVWDGESWRFCGAAEPDASGLDRGWFVGDASHAVAGDAQHAVMAVTWRATGRHFHLPWDPSAKTVNAVDVTARYTERRVDLPPGHVHLWVRVWEAGRRVRADVQIAPAGWNEEPTDARRSGSTRDESADLNDMLEFHVPIGTAWTVTVRRGGAELHHALAATELANDQQIELTAPVAGDFDARLERAFGELARGEALTPLGADADAALLADPAAFRAAAWRAFLATPQPDLRADHDALRVRTSDRTSPYTLESVGERPAGGWPLVIAMHGGGGAPQEVNDQQWQRMQIYYKDHPEAGGYKYIALRAPNNEWNGVYDDAIVPLIDRLVRQLVVCEDVDPSRVYALGYSHGGYGAFVIGPKAADRFAAVHSSAAAASDGETFLENLANLHFSFMVGGLDTAYGRRERCEASNKTLTELRASAAARAPDADLYPFEFTLVEGNGHGGLPDRDLLPKLLAQRRRSAPEHLVWRTSDDRIADQFWLHLPVPKDGAHLVADRVSANRFDVGATGVERVELLLDERLVDPSRPISVAVNGGAAKEYERRPSADVLVQTLWDRADPERSATITVRLSVPAVGVGDTKDR